MTTPTTYDGVMPTILKQYVGSSKLIDWLLLMKAEISIDKFLDDFHDNVWNLDTANSYGLDIWGKIVDLPRTLPFETNEQFFGFNEALIVGTPTATDPTPFNDMPFYSSVYSATGGQVILNDDAYRKAIYMKAMSNITNCTVSNLNNMLMYMFGTSGNSWVERDGPNAMSYHFAFTPSESELAIVQSGILPKPSGAVVSYVFEV